MTFLYTYKNSGLIKFIFSFFFWDFRGTDKETINGSTYWLQLQTEWLSTKKLLNIQGIIKSSFDFSKFSMQEGAYATS